MTKQQLTELIQQHHPSMGDTQVALELNKAQYDFCSRTELLRDTVSFNSVAGKRYYADSELWQNVLKVTQVQFNGNTIPRLIGTPVIDDDSGFQLDVPTSSSNERYWYMGTDTGYGNPEIGIVEKLSAPIKREDKESYYQSCSVAGSSNILVYYIGLPISYAEGTASYTNPLIPEQFHNAFVYRVISDAYLNPVFSLNPEVSQIFDIKYKELVKEGKKLAKSNLTTTGRIVPTEY